MTLSTTDNAISYTGNGTTKAFSFPYRFLSDGHLSVAVAGVEKVLNVDYSVTGAGSASGGTVTFITAPADGESVLIERIVPYTQEADLENFDGYPSDVMEEALDKIVMMIQRLSAGSGRSLYLLSTTALSNFIIPEPSSETKLLGINTADGPVLLDLTSVSASIDSLFTAPAAGHLIVHDGAQWVNRPFLYKKGTTISSASTCDVFNGTSDYVEVSGTATITRLTPKA